MDLKKDLTSFLKKAKNPIIVVLGPTACGKTALSLKIAHKINGEIISTDSRQIYKEMEIGTDTISHEKQEGISHHMLGITTPDKTITLAEYKDATHKIIDEIYKRGSIPILAGGTGLYISAIIENYDIPRIPPDKKLREKLQKEYTEKGVEFLYKKLKKLDPKVAEKIHPNNLRYVIRAIEVAMNKEENLGRKFIKESVRRPKASMDPPIKSEESLADARARISSPGKSSASFQNKFPSQIFDLFIVGISWPREELYERINLRVDLQVKKGLIEEVKNLLEKGYDENLPAMSSLGVKEIIPYIKGAYPLEQCLETLKQNTRRYAKRQMTWFRRYDSVKWLTPEELEKF